MDEIHALFDGAFCLVGRYGDMNHAMRRLRYCERVGIVAYRYPVGCLHREAFDGSGTLLSYGVEFNNVRPANESNL